MLQGCQTRVNDHIDAIERESILRIVRKRESADGIISRMKAMEAALLNELKPWIAVLDQWEIKELEAFATRMKPSPSNYSEYSEAKVA